MGDKDAISLWDVTADSQIGRLEELTGGGLVFAFHPAGAVLASTGWTETLHLWDLNTGRMLFKSPLPMTTVQFSADGRFLAATQHDQGLRIWEMAARDEYRTLAARTFREKRTYCCSAFSSDGRMLAGGAEGGVALWEFPRRKKPGLPQGIARMEPRSNRTPVFTRTRGRA